jgi:hypothetical protein
MEYGFELSAQDLSVALDCEADRAQREGFKHVTERQRASALHIRNAVSHMSIHKPEGYRVRTRVVVDYVPDVNPVLKDEYRKF